MLLDKWDKWKNKMENKDNTKLISGNVQTIETDNGIDITSFADNSVVFLRSKGPDGLYYNANVIVTLKETYEKEVNALIRDRDYWRARCENIQTQYNLQNSLIESADKREKNCKEKIEILSAALTRSKLAERGKLILISRLKNKLNKHGRNKR